MKAHVSSHARRRPDTRALAVVCPRFQEGVNCEVLVMCSETTSCKKGFSVCKAAVSSTYRAREDGKFEERGPRAMRDDRRRG